jgi:hypothetical protein
MNLAIVSYTTVVLDSSSNDLPTFSKKLDRDSTNHSWRAVSGGYQWLGKQAASH